MGEPINQSCLAKPDSSDWFNIRIDEYGEIAAYLRANILKYFLLKLIFFLSL